MIVLAMTYHDPQGRLYKVMQTAVPRLAALFDGFVVNVSERAYAPTLLLWREQGADVRQRPDRAESPPPVGRYRRQAVAQALDLDADVIMLCDADRAAHWAIHHPAELADVVQQLPQADFTVLGRTPRAFATHPDTQVETERIINRVFAEVSGRSWDVLAAARGLSRRAAEAIISGFPDNTFGVDATWPLQLLDQGGFTLAYRETEGLEFETAAAYADEVAAAGGEKAWKASIDADPRQWRYRLQAAQTEVAAIHAYLQWRDAS